ncbi:MAG: chemotaxis response regulator protein-glutamate methylesterase [Porticoccaceae bacterium]|nr:MAG: chemotaxis response regulator protein-glutamate methylesterase [Porticoccaceae bacterium]
MAVRVLVVDDSAFFRRRVTEMLDGDPRLKVVGFAVDGRDAINKARELNPDVITMDIEMPVMDGINAVRAIMAATPKPVLMFSSLTQEGAKATFEALEAGALDFLPKSFAEISRNRDEVARVLRSRVWSLGVRGLPKSRVVATHECASPVRLPSARKQRELSGVRVVAIGTSTGGPVALQQVLSALPANYPIPILLIQHMPASFTTTFAQRLNQRFPLNIREAVNGDVLEPGTALLAPGGQQMLVEAQGPRLRVAVRESMPRQNYRPSVDVTFGSLARACPGRVLAVVLTGMGADGRDGARLLKQGGALVWAQDEVTSVIYGMPMAIAQAGLADEILPLSEIGVRLAELL